MGIGLGWGFMQNILKRCQEDSPGTRGIAGQFLNVKVDYLGFVYDDPTVQTSVIKQKPFLINDPKGKASICIKHITGRLEHVEYREGSGVTRFLRRLMGRMG